MAGGKYPYIDFAEADRWHRRSYRDRRVDVWLISWLASRATDDPQPAIEVRRAS